MQTTIGLYMIGRHDAPHVSSLGSIGVGITPSLKTQDQYGRMHIGVGARVQYTAGKTIRKRKRKGVCDCFEYQHIAHPVCWKTWREVIFAVRVTALM